VELRDAERDAILDRELLWIGGLRAVVEAEAGAEREQTRARLEREQRAREAFATRTRRCGSPT
jgi:hypothetical protein